mgnify:CR=1 FL=1
MDFFDVLTLLGGLSLFLFGMNLMGQLPGKVCRQQSESAAEQTDFP